jgi:dipeptidyl aminopeptidase/acylaminoacyl peptidase
VASLAALLASGAAVGASKPASSPAVAVVHPTPEDIAALRSPSDLRLSPDGRWIVYALATQALDSEAKPSADDNNAGWKRERQLWIVDAAGGEPRQLTRGSERAGSPRWSPDGREIAFLRKLEGKTKIQIISLEGGEAAPLRTGDLEPASLGWSPDGKSLAFTAPDPVSKDEKDAKWKTGGVVHWDSEWRSQHLWIVPRAGGDPRQVTRGEEHVVEWDWSPDGMRFALLTSASADPYEASNFESARIVSASDGAVVRTLSEAPHGTGHPRWSPDGRYVALLTTQESLSMLNVLRVCEADGKRAWNAAPNLETTFATFEWAPDSGVLVAVVRERTKTRLDRFAVAGSSGGIASGAPEDMGLTGRTIDSDLERSRDGLKWAFLSSTEREPSDPTVFDPAGRTLRVVARLNPQVAEWSLGSQEIVRWKSPEGVDLEGLLLLPPHGLRSAPPLLVTPHGGPDDVTQERFSAQAQYFAARGYAVFRPNYRGSLGYGHDIYAANRGRLGEIEFMDIESGVDALIAAGKVDSKRLFYGGWSWGGYLTAWTIGHTNRYRAAVVGAGVNDVAFSYALSDINHGAAAQWEYKGDPWRQRENFDHSDPMHSMRNAVTPTLILHGQSDDRVPFEQGVILYRALRDVGCPVTFYAYPREPHGFTEPAHIVHRLHVWSEWYAQHDDVTTQRPGVEAKR